MSVASHSSDLQPSHLGAGPVRSRRDFESTRCLLGLLDLAALGKSQPGHDDPLYGAIQRPILRSLLSALRYRDLDTVRHSRRVSILAAGLARHLGWDGRLLKLLEVAALLHDIGKLGVPDNILFKPASLSREEREILALHYNVSLDVLQACRVAPEVLEMIGQSQHAYLTDPDGHVAQPQELHLGARILSVADAYESLGFDQPFRAALPHPQILEYLQKHAGRRYDGTIVDALARWLKQDGAPLVDVGYFAEEAITQAATLTSEQALEANSLCRIFSYLHVLESLYDGFSLVDSSLQVIVWNRGLERLLRRPATAALGQPWSVDLLGYCNENGVELRETQSLAYRVLETGVAATGVMHLKRTDGEIVSAEVQCLPVFDAAGQLRGITEIFRDIQNRSGQHPLELRDQRVAASRDALTSVANRGELEIRLTDLVARYQRDPSQIFSTIIIDPDFFRSINETHGHNVGDQVLVALARLLQREAGSGTTVGRYGGEEFVLLCPGHDLQQAWEQAERIRDVIRRSALADIDQLRITVSVGIAEVEPGDSAESLFRRAARALLVAKADGRDRSSRLTAADWQSEDLDATADRNNSEPFVYTGAFVAVITFDMIVHKLRGFIDEHGARIKRVTSESVRLRIGRRNLLGGWGKSPDRQPVDLELLLGAVVQDRGASASRRSNLVYKVRPVGRAGSPEVFQHRARLVIRDLKQFFVTD